MSFKVSVQNDFDPRIEELRRLCFPGGYPSGSAKDRFDDRSLHISITDLDTGELAANGRLCRGPDSFFEEWMGSGSGIPTGAHVADLGRCLVAPSHRGRGLLRQICLEAVQCADELGVTYIVGAVLPDAPFAAMLNKIGYENFGGLIEEREPSGVVLRVQPLLFDLKGSRYFLRDTPRQSATATRELR